MLHTPAKLFIYIGIEAAGCAPVPGLGFGLSSPQGVLSAPDSPARAAPLLLIGASRDPTLADAVGSALSDNEWSVRAVAAHLVAMHPFPALQDKSHHRESYIRSALLVRGLQKMEREMGLEPTTSSLGIRQ
jgi:hypothetical protein